MLRMPRMRTRLPTRNLGMQIRQVSTYINRDGTPKEPFTVGQTVRVIATKDTMCGRLLTVLYVDGNCVRLEKPDSGPRGDRYWSYEVETT